MNTLKLTLKKQWFDLIKEGIKTEEYREIKDYWVNRLVKEFSWGNEKDHNWITKNGLVKFSKMEQFDKVEFTNGYNKNSPQITVELLNIIIGQGLPEWGAVNGQEYFIIKLGREVGRQNC